ncbi:MAG: fused response regulator/phosphatase [Anaerolineaceae bacterium]|jgi:serine phosphatase RsbU (regulator of sigma subunit)|nr:fused response regulator/phosphatase [Anaerolineaceae bacterium]MDD4043758.1 fused response regulator/phosphatase [Anaerolineaceae bacterium]MDD4577692.1 fused response regulator/phosphatase [Anaerolineaceae bacterium]
MKTLSKILIVDDEPFNVDYLEQELEGSDYDIITATNGQDALEKVRSEAPDLVLLDIMMPVIDGFTVLTQLKAEASSRDIPVVIISASNDLKNVVKGIQMGAEDYLPKPFEPTLLHARVSSSLEKKRLHDLQKLYLKSLEREFEIAREIQLSFLPTHLPTPQGWEVAAYFKAAREVAGDFYDAFMLPNDQLVFIVGDVCGKGIGAALFMTLYRSLIHAAASTKYFTVQGDGQGDLAAQRLKQVISCANNYVMDTHEDAKFTTLFIGLVELKTGRITFANCGNEPPLLIRKDGSLTDLNPTGPAIGIFKEIDFAVGEVFLEKDDLLLAYTDGITDTINAENSTFGKRRLEDFVRGFTGVGPDLLNLLVTQAHEFAEGVEQFDDITLMALRRDG